MRVRFFLIILGIFLFTVTVLGAAQYILSRSERLRLVDQQIEEMASAIYSSDVSSGSIEDIEEANEIIADALEDERLNAVISIFDRTGKILYQNRNAKLIGNTFNATAQKEMVERQGHVIRLLNVAVSDKNLILQVGLILDQALVRWRWISYRMLIYMGLTLFFIISIAYFLSYLLLRPIEKIAEYLQYRALHFDMTLLPTTAASDSPPNELTQLVRRHGFWGEDEFWHLTTAVQFLIQRVQETARDTKVRTAQLAHELKTPLTIAQNSIEHLSRSLPPNTLPMAREASNEILRLTQLVNGFTQWSLFDSSPSASDQLFAIHVGKESQSLMTKLERIYPQRIRLKLLGSPVAFAEREHFEQAISNLVVNAVTYSDSAIDVEVTADFIQIRNEGSQIPQEVLGKVGAPFNTAHEGSNRGRGTGLGLAWVAAICKRYQWKFEIKNEPHHVNATIIFPSIRD